MTCPTCHDIRLVRTGAPLPTLMHGLFLSHQPCPDCPEGREMQRRFEEEIAEHVAECARVARERGAE